MLTHANLGNNGRLGNQLFQIAALIGIARHNNTSYKLPQWAYAKHFQNYKPTLTAKQQTAALNTWDQFNEANFAHNDITVDVGRDINLNGYFQSEKYFYDKEEIKRLFQIANYAPLFEPTCAIHIRRGDYVDHPHYYNCPLSYYRAAIAHILSKEPTCTFKIHSDDINWCKDAFKDIPVDVEYSSGTEIDDLKSITECKHFICANSSFSWWGAWLGEKEGSIIIFPHKWLLGEFEKKNPTHDIVPDRWHKGAPHAAKIDLKDVTFTIPVMYDHADRKANLDLCIHFLRHHFDTNISVAEWGTDPHFAYTKDYGAYTHYNQSGAFHRTRMLNDMALAATTPYVFNYDADVFFDPQQLLSCINKLRTGKASGCYPYDGRFYRVDRQYLYLLASSMQVSDLLHLPYPDKAHTETSYGGAIAWNKEKFIACGLENEYMISFGPEDYERFDRAKRLGFFVDRVKGPLFHINHYTGPDSSTTNPHFKHNWAEYDKIKTFPDHRLTEFVESWPWRKCAVETLSVKPAPNSPYDEKFYQEINESALRSADIILPILRQAAPFKTVLDVGCGQGAWGMSIDPVNYTGIDGDYIQANQLLIQPDQFIAHDLTKKINLRKKFDLVISLEVAEHLPPEAADTFIDNLCRHSDTILFSAAIPKQGGNNHLNEQWQSYWADKFITRGFAVYDFIREQIWNNKDVPYYYRQNILVFSKRVLETYNRPVIDVVHPDKYMEEINAASI